MSDEYELPEERIFLAGIGDDRKAIIRRRDGAVLATGSDEAVTKTAFALGLPYEEGPEVKTKRRKDKTVTSCSTASLDYAWLQTKLCISGRRDPSFETLRGPAMVAELVHRVYDLANEVNEVALVLAVNHRNQPLGLHVVAKGNLASVSFNPASVMRPVLLLQADGFFLLHNHPSGDLNPSSADEVLTERVRDAAKVVDLRFLDHVIVTPKAGAYYSFVTRTSEA